METYEVTEKKTGRLVARIRLDLSSEWQANGYKDWKLVSGRYRTVPVKRIERKPEDTRRERYLSYWSNRGRWQVRRIDDQPKIAD